MRGMSEVALRALTHIIRSIRNVLYEMQAREVSFMVFFSCLASAVHELLVALLFHRSMFQFSLLLLSASTIYSHAQAAICTSARGLLPTISDCKDIAEAIHWLSRLPNENNMKAWGRGLPSTLDTEKVPKVFWISGRGPTTCAVHVDVDAYDTLAVDDFRVSDVASAADEVIAQCLVKKSKVGLAYPAGMDGHVHAKVIVFVVSDQVQADLRT